MTAKTHLTAGLLTGLVVSSNVPGTTPKIAVITASLIGSIISDIDIQQSKISYLVFPLRLLHNIVCKIIRLIGKLLPNKAEKSVMILTAHRGFTHSLVYAEVLCIMTCLISKYFFLYPKDLGIGIGVGIVSHIVLDMLSGGAVVFAPFINKRITISKIRTGSITELIFLVVMGTASIIYISMKGIL